MGETSGNCWVGVDSLDLFFFPCIFIFDSTLAGGFPKVPLRTNYGFHLICSKQLSLTLNSPASGSQQKACLYGLQCVSNGQRKLLPAAFI